MRCNDTQKNSFECSNEWHNLLYHFHIVDDNAQKITIKLSDGELLTVSDKELFFKPEAIQMQLASNQNIINFGYVGVKRELIEWYIIENEEDINDEDEIINAINETPSDESGCISCGKCSQK